MKIWKCLMAFFAFTLFANAAFSQSVDDGIKDLYYEKYQTAKQTLQKVIAAKPDDRAYYYLGLADLGLGDKNAAKADFQKGLQVNANSPLNLVGLARIDILDTAYDAGKQKLQKAFDLSEGRDFEVGRAILEATAQSPKADNTYALDLMKQIKDNRKNRKKEFTPEDFMAMGDAQRNLPNGGGDAAADYENALALSNNTNAQAYAQLGDLLLGARAFPQAVENFEKAIAADPNYAPAYLDLYQYYRYRDLAKSKENLEKYMALSDDKVNAQVYLVDILYLQQDYKGAVDKANAIMDQVSPVTKTRLYELIADSKSRSGDTTGAKEYMEKFLQQQDASKIRPFDYQLYGNILMMNKQDSLANIYYAKSIAIDTTTNPDALRDEAEQLRKQNNFGGAALYYQKILNIAKDHATVDDYFWYGFSNFYTNKYDSAVTIFKEMAQKFPEKANQLVAYFYWGKSLMAKDTASTGVQGYAVEPFKKYLSLVNPDSTKKDNLATVYYYLGLSALGQNDYTQAGQYADKLAALGTQNEIASQIYSRIALAVYKTDRPTATAYAQKALTINPSDSTAQAVLDYYKKLDDYNQKMKAYKEKQKANGGK